ncbi:tetratricopeptide repeat protein [Helicobacter cholecystus]|uniref:tetratricopeptide repeat protein n=1 Tax=Helicobacter cholecystus TaxID=45498 RepID=UPI002739B45F|nr:tetratricopeptide repeat protein [Helicobacter cholecystus]
MKVTQFKDSFFSMIKAIGEFFKRNIHTKENRTSSYVVLALLGGLFIFYLFYTLIADTRAGGLTSKEVQIQLEKETKESEEKVQEGQLLQRDLVYSPPNNELSEMIAKANILYNNGRVEDALEIFNKLALYSQSLANYNLGVIKIVEGRYKEAEEIFNRAIDGGDDVSLSAINAAYVAYKLGNQQAFSDYLQLANSKLIDSRNAPFYSYLYGITSYYNRHYFESLSPLLHPNTQDYEQQNNLLASKIFLIFNDDVNALKHLEKSANKEDFLALGMLYARNGDYQKARDKIEEYLLSKPRDLQAINALELVNLKLRNYTEAARLLDSFLEKKMPFKIKTGLNEDLFDINIAQQTFWNRKFEHRQSLQYKILFYYAPYKVFDSQEVFRILSEGNFEWGAGRIDESSDSYIRSKTISKINRDIANGLKEIYNGDLRNALKIFLKNAKTYSQHSVLFYDIGLIYAQLGDFEKAFTYFSRAYYLNNKDILSGIFAVMSGQLVYQDTSRIESSISVDFANLDFKNDEEKTFLFELFEYSKSGKTSFLSFSNNVTVANHPIYYAFGAVSAMGRVDGPKLIECFSKLREIQPNDLVTNILYEISKNFGKNLKDISLNFSQNFREGNFSNLHSLYYGGALVRELYIYLAFVTGSLSYIIEELQNRLISEDKSPNGTMQALGLAYIYHQDFEKAFATYNTLIDNLGEDDARTKFLGAVSAIGAEHYNNAVALLQISKLDSIASLESRYALGLLYQQVGNIKSAIMLFDGIANKNFRSEFFDFQIDSSDLLEAEQK